ncbi:membrane-associated protein, putative, partial [Bodo saltans]
CVSIVSGLNGSQSICHSLAIALAVILVAQLLLLILVKPYTTLFSHVYSVVSLTLTTLSVIAQVLYMLTLSSSASGLWLLQVSTICNFATIGVNAVKMLLDLVQFCRSVARRLGLDCNNISPAVTAPDELLRAIDVSGHTYYSPTCVASDEGATELMYVVASPPRPATPMIFERSSEKKNSIDVSGHTYYSPTCVASDEGATELMYVVASPPRPATPMIFERSSVQPLDDLGVLWIDHETALAGTSDIMAIGRSSDFRRGDFLSQFLMPPDRSH